jgi:hypothetical protein
LFLETRYYGGTNRLILIESSLRPHKI